MEKIGRLPVISGCVFSVLGLVALWGSMEMLKSALVLVAVLFTVLVYVLTRFTVVRSVFWLVNTFVHWIQPTFFEVLEHVLKVCGCVLCLFVASE